MQRIPAMTLVVLLAAAALAGAQPSAEPPALTILKEALARPNDAEFLAQQLARVDALINKGPDSAINYYARGWMLSKLKRPLDAVAAYDRAAALDPKLVDALYNAGIALAALQRHDEALARWQKAIAIDPSHVDALYNAAQTYYNQKVFRQALDYWSRARAIAPNDFEITKKVLQAQNALGERDAAARTRDALFAMRRSSSDPRVRGLKEYVFHQFDVGKAHVYAYETFEPAGERYYAYRCLVEETATGAVAGSVTLDSSPASRSAGKPYVLGVTLRGGSHRATGPEFAALPAWTELQATVEKLVRAEFPAVVAER
jgi:tetratricopeptide (TPR) repeat protein